MIASITVDAKEGSVIIDILAREGCDLAGGGYGEGPGAAVEAAAWAVAPAMGEGVFGGGGAEFDFCVIAAEDVEFFRLNAEAGTQENSQGAGMKCFGKGDLARLVRKVRNGAEFAGVQRGKLLCVGPGVKSIRYAPFEHEAEGNGFGNGGANGGESRRMRR